MKLIVFGATGTIGRQLVDQALAQGHRVTAFARTPEPMDSDPDTLIWRRGNVLDREAVADAMHGHDAVLVALGVGAKGGIRTFGTENVIKGMERHGIKRLICLSTLGAGDSHSTLNFFWKHVMFGWLLKAAYADHQAQEAAVTTSNLDWTIVRPGAFTNGPATGAYRHGFAPTEKKLKFKVSRADVAQFMLRQLTGNAYLRQAPGVSY
jgi:uncharacterized protein YbjT (DUF2867 family)